MCVECGIGFGWLGSQVGYQGILDLGSVCEWRVWDQLARDRPYGLKPIETDAWSSHPLHTHADIGMTFQVKSKFISKFCLFALLLHLLNICETCLANCSISHICTHSLIPVCTPTGSRHRLWNSLAVYLGETIGVQPASTRRVALDFTSCCRLSTYYTHLTCRNFICQYSAIVKTTVKQRPLAFILLDCQCWDSPALYRSSTIFSTINNYITTSRGLMRDTQSVPHSN